MIFMDGITEGKEADFKVRTALSASGKYDPEMLFADQLGITPPVVEEKTTTDTEPINDAETDFDYSGVKWELPSDGDKDALAQLAQIMSNNESVVVSGDSQEDDDETDLSLSMVPDDREWL